MHDTPASGKQVGTADAPHHVMMMSKKNLKSLVGGVIAAMPAVPYIMRSRKTSIASYVLGGIGFALAGGIVALMVFSPRTRTRAMHAARDTYGKVNEKIGHLRSHERSAKMDELPISNGLSGRSDYSASGV